MLWHHITSHPCLLCLGAKRLLTPVSPWPPTQLEHAVLPQRPGWGEEEAGPTPQAAGGSDTGSGPDPGRRRRCVRSTPSPGAA